MTLAPFDLRTDPLAPGTHLIEASAGTGKTYTLVGVFLRLLVEKQIGSLGEALVVTFTTAATEELKTRLREGLARALHPPADEPPDSIFRQVNGAPDAPTILADAIEHFDEIHVATIHGFCKRLLDEAAFESHEPFRLEFTSDPAPLQERAAADALRQHHTAGPSLRAALLHAAGFTPEELAVTYREWQRNFAVRLRPDPSDPDAALVGLERALAAAAAACVDEVAPSLAAIPWNKDQSPFGEDSAAAIRGWLAAARQEPLRHLGTLRQLSRDQLYERRNKRKSGYREPALAGPCTELEAAWNAALEHLRASLLRSMHERLEVLQRREHVLSFQDLLLRTQAALLDPARRVALVARVQQRHRVVLIDEFQDTDPVQFAIFSTCFAGRPMYYVGDPKQSIYGFRGADLGTYLLARGRADERHTLGTNHRSARGLVAAVQSLFARSDAFVTEGIEMPAVHAAAAPGRLSVDGDGGAPFRWRFVAPGEDHGKQTKADGRERILDDVAAEISRLLRGGATLDGGRLQPDHFAVLVRTNDEAHAVKEALVAIGVPAAISKSGDVFATDERRDLELLLAAVLRPGDLTAVRAAMATRLWGADVQRLAPLARDDSGLDVELARLAGFRDLLTNGGVVALQHAVFAELGVPARLLALPGGERRLTNLQQLFELLHEQAHGHHLPPDSLLPWLRAEAARGAAADPERRELRLESDGRAVTVQTVHGSKGLEYEIVFCPFLWGSRQPAKAGVVPLPDGLEYAFDLPKGDPRGHALEVATLAEAVRLAYVAVTRARRRCYVHWGPIGTTVHRSALSWVLADEPVPREGPEWLTRWFEARKGAGPALRGELERLVARAGGTMDLALVPDAPAPQRVPAEEFAPLAPPRTPRAEVIARAVHSFSSLTSGAQHGEAARDVADRPAPSAVPAASATGVYAFARGADAGVCLHTILEHADLGALEAPSTRGLVREQLRAANLLDPTAHRGELDPEGTVLQLLRDLAAARLAADGPTFHQLASGAKQAEWQFTLPVPHARLHELADLFARLGSPAARTYAPTLRQLPPRALHGFLTGVVDLLAEHGGRWFVVDWKSNHLGDTASDYGPAALQETMQRSHYVLQYHLYLLALHRHLRSRLRGYDPARHLGGIGYVFLRGLRAGTADGVFSDVVPPALVEALDRWAGPTLTGGAP